MKPLAKFEEFIERGVVVKRTPDTPRMNFLIKESDRKFKSLSKFIEKVGIIELNAHEIIEYCYDIIIYLVRAKLYEAGFSSSGEGGHEAEVAYMRNLGFSENDVLFMNQLRYFRNAIKYYGKSLDKEYAEKVKLFLDKIHPKLISLSKK